MEPQHRSPTPRRLDVAQVASPLTDGAGQPVVPGPTCSCGHVKAAHEHYRRGSDCAFCTCVRFAGKRRPRLTFWRRGESSAEGGRRPGDSASACRPGQPAVPLPGPSLSGSAGSWKPITRFTAWRRERSSSVRGRRSIT